MKFSKYICADGIWNQSLFQNPNYPIFTNCFQCLLLLISPVAIFTLFLLFLLGKCFYQSKSKDLKLTSFDVLHTNKILTAVLSAVYLMIEMIVIIYFNQQNDSMLIVSYFTLSISLIIVSLSMELRRRGNQSIDGILFLFWWLTTGSYVIRYYSHFVKFFQVPKQIGVIQLTISSIIMFILLLSLILDCFSRFPKSISEKVSPEKHASILSQITFTWLDKYIYRWYKTEMTDETCFDLNSSEKGLINSENCLKVFNDNLKHAKINSKFVESSEKSLLINKEENNQNLKIPRGILLKSLFQVYFPLTILAWIFIIIRDILIVTLPLLLRYLLHYFKAKEESYTWKGIMFGLIFFFQGFLGSLFENYCQALTIRVSVQVRGSLIGMIYKKTILLSTEARALHSAGDIVNMAGVDMEQIMNAIIYSWTLISSPFHIILAIVLLYFELGYSIFAGVLIIIAVIPINTLIMKFTRKYSENELMWKDKRMNVLTEILNGMKVIKMHTWEKCFNHQVETLRKEEINNIKNVTFGWSVMSIMWDIVPFLVMFTTFAFYIYFVASPIITPEKIFVSLVLFNNLQQPILLLPWGFSQAITAYVSFGRIENFLLASERKDNTNFKDSMKIDPNLSVEIKDGNFAWSDDGKPIIKRINISLEKAKLIAIVGKVGVGKSSLLSAILGEMYCLNGTIETQGTIGYVPQQAWIQNNSLRNNILFIKPFDDSLYNKVLEACCLEYDLENFPNHDQTEIGERGINLSGGQKQRISLARAVYQDCDIYLLDDPLSAVDVNVGQNLFNNVISNEGMLKHKTRILVTHGIKWLPFVDEILVMNSDGEISERGSYENLIKSGKEFKLFIKESGEKSDVKQTDKKQASKSDENFEKSSLEIENFKKKENSKKPLEKTKSESENEEEIMSGRVSIKSIFWYFKANGTCVFMWSTFACIIFGTLQALGNCWLGKLSNNQTVFNVTNNEKNRNNAKYYINFYGIIGIGQCIAAILFWIGFTYGSLNASKKIHSVLLDSVLRATMSFFDVTPSGRILNRFTKDLFVIDHVLNFNITDIINRIVLLLTSFTVITIVTPWFGLTGIPILAIYILLQLFYISTSRQSRRLDSQASSFVFTHIMETYNGCSVIRSFNAEKEFENIQYNHIDNSNKFKYIQYFSLRWLCLRLDILGNLIVFGSVIFAVINRFSLNASLVGLSISYALQITGILNWLTRQCSDFETNAVSIERIRQYTMTPTENLEDRESNPPDSWVSTGNIAFENFSLKYNTHFPNALKNININIKGGEKVGVVGRTGAGKSSLTLALFRLIEGCGGKIIIDGVNINLIGLHRLRKQLNILPQDPMIFSGTIKQNLDPFDEYTKDELIKSLTISGMIDWFNALSDGLNHDCGNSGTNLSSGQKQLICLARTILKNSKIIILDEATSSVDEETDRKVIEAIKNHFTNSTVILIAHRIKTIIDCDKIIFLDNGSVIEFGSPKDLLSKTSGHFKSLVMSESGMKT